MCVCVCVIKKKSRGVPRGRGSPGIMFTKTSMHTPRVTKRCTLCTFFDNWIYFIQSVFIKQCELAQLGYNICCMCPISHLFFKTMFNKQLLTTPRNAPIDGFDTPIYYVLWKCMYVYVLYLVRLRLCTLYMHIVYVRCMCTLYMYVICVRCMCTLYVYVYVRLRLCILRLRRCRFCVYAFTFCVLRVMYRRHEKPWGGVFVLFF